MLESDKDVQLGPIHRPGLLLGPVAAHCLAGDASLLEVPLIKKRSGALRGRGESLAFLADFPHQKREEMGD